MDVPVFAVVCVSNPTSVQTDRRLNTDGGTSCRTVCFSNPGLYNTVWRQFTLVFYLHGLIFFTRIFVHVRS